jgi:hypothetical protein
MRAMRLALVGLVIPGLFAGLCMAVAAQEDEQEPPTATYVTGVAVLTQEGDIHFISQSGDGRYLELEMDWSDPRLPSRMLVRANPEGAQGIHPDGYGVTARIAIAVRLEGPEGSWSGTGHSLAWTLAPESGVGPQDTRTEVKMLVLDSEGDYEGLSATLTGTGDGVVPAYEGFIFENALTMPDPIEPTSE